MARSDETPPGENRNLVREKKVQMAEAKDLYRRARNRGRGTDIGRRVRVELATALMNYYDAVWEYADEDQRVAQAWDEYNMSQIERLDAETVEVPTATAGDTRATELVEESKLVMTDPAQLVEWSKQLDYLAKKLGLGKDIDSNRPTGRIGSEDLYE